MTFQSDKTGEHLRSQALQQGTEERMRAVQALSHGYGTGSKAAIASLLLATLGGTKSDVERGVVNQPVGMFHGVVAEPMQASANDESYAVEAKSTVG
jgi:hypothetical protein